MISIMEAIKAINPIAECTVINEDINQIIWNDNTTPISKEDILSKKTELQAEYDALDYARLREKEYPPTKEFMEAYTEKEIGGDSTKWDSYIVKYNKVRSDNPK